MTPKNMYYFKDRHTRGINLVPVNSLVEVEKGLSGKPEFFTLLHKAGLNNSSTIANVLGTPDQFRRLAMKQDITYNYKQNTIHFNIVK